MFKTYLKTSLRTLWKNRGFSFLNITGLAIGIACASLIFLWVEDEVTFNHYFQNRDNLYKVKDNQTYDGSTYTFDATPGPLAQGLKLDIPGIRNTARSSWGNRVLFSLKDQTIYEQGAYVDSTFLSMFQLHFLNGDPGHAFDQLYSIVLSRKMAVKFFGSTDIVGKTIKVDNNHDYVISGVFEDLPENVSFKFDWLSPFQIMLNDNSWLLQWGNNGIVTYVETYPNVSIEKINKQLHGYIQTKDTSLIARLALYPMNRWRLYDSFENGKEVPGRIKYVNLFSLIAWIILIIACINFMNLATARSEQRAREIGVRKVLGAGRSKLIVQFIGESLLMSIISAVLAVIIVYLSISAFNNLVQKHLSVNLLEPVHLVGLLTIAILCGLIAGSYPAFYLSSFNPIGILKAINVKSASGTAIIRKGLVVMQFAVSIIFIISTIIIYLQIEHVKDRNIGYNREGLVYLDLTGNMKNNFGVIKQDFLQTGLISNAALSSSMSLELGSNSGNFEWEGKDPSKQILITQEAVSPEYISTIGMKLTSGRDFYPDMKSDSNNIIINEALAKIIHHKQIIGTVISRGGGSRYTVVGVVKDFLYNDMYSSPAPLILFSDTSSFINFLSIRLNKNANLGAAISGIASVLKKDNPGYPVESKFVDKSFDQLFQTETLIGNLAGVFAILAIIISCLGLFGLAAYTAERRTKEIGIRKILGASVQGLAGLLSRDFLLLVVLSCMIAFPVAWWTMSNWLLNYQYHIVISWWIFIGSGLTALFIALITVSFQAIKAAVANPVKSLRTE